MNLSSSAVKPGEAVNVTSSAGEPPIIGDVSPEECKVSLQKVPETSISVAPAKTTEVNVPQRVETRKDLTPDVTKVDSSDAARHTDTSVEGTTSSVSAQTAQITPDEASQRQTIAPSSVSAQTTQITPDETPQRQTIAPSSVSAQTPHVTSDETPQQTNAPSSVSAQTPHITPDEMPQQTNAPDSVSAQTTPDAPIETNDSVGPAPHQMAALTVSPLTLHEGVNLDIIVTEVISPSLFWVQPLSSKLPDMMSDLM